MLACVNKNMKVRKKNDYKSIALPAELQGLNEFVLIIFQLINTFLYSLNGEKQ
jgi:hypothetical protein